MVGIAQAPADTGKAKQLGTVIVSASSYYSFKRQTDLTSALARNKGNTLTDLLQENTAVYLKNYGPGMLSTIAFRGTGAEHTALVWNGININYPMLGLADFATVPASGFSNVALLHGSSSSQFGSSAIGGTVMLDNSRAVEFTPVTDWNIDPTTPAQHGFNIDAIKATATFETGSYNRYFTNAAVTVEKQKFVSRTNLLWLDADNDFRFKNTFKLGFPVERQVNSGIKQGALMQDFDFVTGKKSFASVRGWYNYTDRLIPPTLTSVATAAQQKDESIRLMGEWNYRAGFWLTLRGAYVNDYIGYADLHTISNARVSTSTLQAHYNQWLGSNFTLNADVEGQFFTADIKEYSSFKTEWRGSVYARLSYQRSQFAAQLAYRHILVQGGINAPAPTFGVRYTIESLRLALKANVSRSYRVPTLNERYWTPGGNPNLQPEGGWAYELGLERSWYWKIKNSHWNISTEFTGFYMQVNNWLQWQPTNFGYWQANNLKQVLSRGAEATANLNGTIGKFTLKWNAAYALAVATNKHAYNGMQTIIGRDLIYTPRNVASTGLTLEYAGFSLFVNLQYTGLRYTTTDNSQNVKGYTLLNARLSKDIKLKNIRLSLWLQGLNIGNSTYYNLQYRPMPLFNYRAGLTISFEKVKYNKTLSSIIITNEK